MSPSPLGLGPTKMLLRPCIKTRVDLLQLHTQVTQLKKKMEDPQINPDLPHHLLSNEILPKLPAKSLIHFKSVSKSWLSTISSSNFAHLHSLTRPHNYGILIQTQTQLYSIQNFPSLCQSFDLSQHKVTFNHHGINGSFNILDSCNGLVCLRLHSGEMRIWNPFTKQCRKVPKPESRNYETFEPCLYAFGFVATLDDYKIVELVNYLSLSVAGHTGVIVRVYSCSSSKWIEFEDDNVMQVYVCRPPCKAGVVLSNSKAHWLLGNYTHHRCVGLTIVVCDLWSEVCGHVPVPEELDEVGKEYLRAHACIGVVEKDLCIVTVDKDHCFVMWVLEEYGNWGSWKKFLKVSGVMSPCVGNLSFCSFRIADGGKFLMQINGDVWLCCWSDGIPEFVQIEGQGTLHLRRFDDTLVSPFLPEKV